MGVRIGLVGHRADLAVEVGTLAAELGAEVVSLHLADLSTFAAAPAGVDLVVVDVAAIDAGAVVGSAAGAGVGLGDARREWRGALPPCDPPTAPQAGDGVTAGPSGAHVIVVCRAGEVDAARAVAEQRGCEHVVELPLGGPWLRGQLAPSTTSGVLAVVGAVGGVGATTLAIACAFGAGADCLLVDADPDSTGLDLPLGIAEGVGVRWPEIPDTGAPLDPVSLRAALPTVDGVPVVTGGVHASAGPSSGGPPAVGDAGLRAGRLDAILGVARAEFDRTVLDAGRGRLPRGLVGPGDAAVLVLPATLAGVVAGRRALAGLGTGRVVVALRPTGWIPAHEVGEQLGVPVAIAIPRLRRAPELTDCGDLLSGRTGRCLRALGEQVWEQLR